MRWYEGAIPAAIQESKNRPSVLVVYITGQDDMSQNMDQTWESPEVTQATEQEHMVCLKLKANSDECGQFSVIYPVVCVPCTFFIGNNGVPIEVTGGLVQVEEFVQKVNNVAKVFRETVQEGKPPAPDSQRAAAQTDEPSMPSEHSEGATAAVAGTSKDLDIKVQRAKELVDKKRAEKAVGEEEETHMQEMERRKQGKDMTQLKERQKEQRQKEEANEWKREREDKRLERERIKEQLARDRVERDARFKEEKEERARATAAVKARKAEGEAEAAAQSQAVKREMARIQFRLPDGSFITKQFASSQTLSEARDFLRERIGNTLGTFTMSTHYPNRDYCEEDMPSTLLELDLSPSAVIIVLPGARGTSVAPSGGSGGSGIIWLLLSPFLVLWTFVYNLIAGAPSQPHGAYNPPDNPVTTQPQSSAQPWSRSDASRSRSEASGSSSGGPTHSRDRPKSSYGTRSRREGNIQRFSAEEDDDEDMGTWNGNSTQQM